MATVGEAIRQLGIVTNDGEIVVVRLKSGKAENYLLNEVADKAIGKDLYLKTGTFATGSISRYEGASAKNLIRINELPFDFDLADSTGIPKDELWQMPDAALWPLIEWLRGEVEAVFASIGLALHRIDYTGYGLAGYLRLPLHKPDAIPEIQELHARIVKRVNAIARVKLCDPQVTDAGTRFMRIPGCLNTKGPIPRQTRTLMQRDGMVNESELRVAAGATSTLTPRIIPTSGAAIDDATVAELIAAVGPHWRKGTRHGIALALAGLLAKANVPEEQAVAIVRGISDADGDYWDRPVTEVSTTYKRASAGLPVAGYTKLSDELPADLVAWLDALGQRLRQATTPTLVAHGRAQDTSEEEPKRKRNEFADVPESVLTGWIGDYARLMHPTTEAPLAFHVGVGLTMAGALLGRHVYNQYGTDPLYANLYTLLVGRSGRTRKDTAIKRATRVLFDSAPIGGKIIQHGIGIATDIGSSTKLIDLLAKHPNTMLYLTEFSRLMGNARRQSTDTIIPTLMEAFDTPTVMQNQSMANPIEAAYPYLSIIAATQPDILAETMSGADMNSGFANRWLFICGNLGSPNPLPPVLDRAIVGKLLNEFWAAKHSYEVGTGLRMSDEATARWREWYIADFERESPTAEEDAMRARHAVLIQKIALIYAIAEQARRIEVHHLEIGISLIEWMWDQIKRLTPQWGRSTDGQIEERIKAVLAEGPMKRRELQGRCGSRKWSNVEFGRVFKAMVENQMIAVDPFGFVGLSND